MDENTEVVDQVQGGDQPTDQATQEQSNKEAEPNNSVEVKPEVTVELPDGRKVTPEQAVEEYKKLQADYTRKSQRLSELEKSAQQREVEAKTIAREVTGSHKLLEEAPQDVKEAIGMIAAEILQKELEKRDVEARKREDDAKFEQRLSSLEKEFPGGNGKPKFDRSEVLKAMQDPTNEIFDPKVKFFQMNERTFNDILVKEALKKQSSGTKTEDTTGAAPRKPEGNAPSNWEEAARNAMHRLSNQ